MRDKKRELQLILDLAAAWCEDWQEPSVDLNVVLGCYGQAWGDINELYLTPSFVPALQDGAEWLWEGDKWERWKRKSSKWSEQDI